MYSDRHLVDYSIVNYIIIKFYGLNYCLSILSFSGSSLARHCPGRGKTNTRCFRVKHRVLSTFPTSPNQSAFTSNSIRAWTSMPPITAYSWSFILYELIFTPIYSPSFQLLRGSCTTRFRPLVGLIFRCSSVSASRPLCSEVLLRLLTRRPAQMRPSVGSVTPAPPWPPHSRDDRSLNHIFTSAVLFNFFSNKSNIISIYLNNTAYS